MVKFSFVAGEGSRQAPRVTSNYERIYDDGKV